MIQKSGEDISLFLEGRILFFVMYNVDLFEIYMKMKFYESGTQKTRQLRIGVKYILSISITSQTMDKPEIRMEIFEKSRAIKQNS